MRYIAGKANSPLFCLSFPLQFYQRKKCDTGWRRVPHYPLVCGSHRLPPILVHNDFVWTIRVTVNSISGDMSYHTKGPSGRRRPPPAVTAAGQPLRFYSISPPVPPYANLEGHRKGFDHRLVGNPARPHSNGRSPLPPLPVGETLTDEAKQRDGRQSGFSQGKSTPGRDRQTAGLWQGSKTILTARGCRGGSVSPFCCRKVPFCTG